MTSSMSHPAGAADPATTLQQVRQVQDRTRHDLRSFWFPLVVFGALTLASTVTFILDGGGHVVAAYWAVAGPVGGAAIARYYHSRQERLGVSRSGAPFIATALALFVAAFFLPAVTTGALQEVVSAMAVGAAYLMFAWFDRSRLLVVLGVAMVAVPAGALVAGLDHPGGPVAATTGAATLIVGLLARRSERRGA